MIKESVQVNEWKLIFSMFRLGEQSSRKMIFLPFESISKYESNQISHSVSAVLLAVVLFVLRSPFFFQKSPFSWVNEWKTKRVKDDWLHEWKVGFNDLNSGSEATRNERQEVMTDQVCHWLLLFMAVVVSCTVLVKIGFWKWHLQPSVACHYTTLELHW